MTEKIKKEGEPIKMEQKPKTTKTAPANEDSPKSVNIDTENCGNIRRNYGMIYSAINGVMDDIGAITKSSRNQQQGFMYRGIDAVMNALQPALVKHKIMVIPEVLEQTREERQTKSGGNMLYSILRIRYSFVAVDGSCVEAIVIGEGMDSGDKASNKAMSVAFKYACFQVFCIPTEEMKDPDENTPEPSLPKVALMTEAQRLELENYGVDFNAMAKFYKVASPKQITSAMAASALAKKRGGA